MKTILILACSILTALQINHAFAQAVLPAFEPHPWTVTVEVNDEDGKAVSEAEVSVQYSVPTRQNTSEPTFKEIKGFTDTNGFFTASHTDTSADLGVTVAKSNYYPTHVGHQIYFSGQFDAKTVEASRNPSLKLTLKKIGEPAAMYVRHIKSEPRSLKKTGTLPISLDKTVGYDLIAGDWLAPDGKGVNSDIFVKEEFHKTSATEYDLKFTLFFPNSADGIQEYSAPESERGSILRSPHEAPLDGYQSQLFREVFHHAGQSSQSDHNENRIYFIRVRTVLDAAGNIKSALYGKIYGDPVLMNFRYFLNPSPNSRNIEFDTKHNMFSEAKSFENLSAP